MYYFRQLKNGLEVGVAPVEGDETATILLSFRVGSKHEPKLKNGIAHFIEHMFFKGTRNRPALTQSVREIERLGGFFNGFTVKEFSWLYIKLLNNDLEKAMEVLQDAVTNPLFLPKEFEKEKQIILEEINIYHDSAGDLVEDLFDKCLYGEQSLAWPTLGEPKIIKNLKKSDLIDFFKEFYVAPNAALTIAGGIDPSKSLELAEKYFSDLPSGKKLNNIEMFEKQTAPQALVRYKKIKQSQIALGVRTFHLNHQDHYTAKLIAILLGGNMSARLFTRLREELGLVYEINTMSESRTNTGYLATYTGLEKSNISKSIKEIVNEYKKLTGRKIKETELTDAKNFLLNKKMILSRDSEFVALDLAKRLIFKKKAIIPEQYRKQIEEVSPEDILRVADNIFKNEGLNLAIVGSIKEKDKDKYAQILHF